MINKDWIRNHAEEEISGAKEYFKVAQECDDEEMSKEFICMGKQELEHAGKLYGMMAW